MTVAAAADDAPAAPSADSPSSATVKTPIPPRPPPIDRSWLRTLLSSHSHQLDPTCPSLTDPKLHNKALAVAPMVDQSDLPFRLLCRRHGANIAYTPMIHARLFVEKKSYRAKFWNFVDGTPSEDRPLIAQFCGSDPDVLLAAMKKIQHAVDAVDINCGCPQGIARKGKYGAFLLESPALPDLVRHLASNLDVPVTVKVRILPSGVDESLDLYEKLVDAGVALLTVHGRDRNNKGPQTGPTDWDAIRRTVERIGHRVPVLANGSISNLDDVRDCIEKTGVDGAMSSEAILEYPPLFSESHTRAVDGRRVGPGRVQLARDYLDLCRQHPPDSGGQGSGLKCVRVHLHRFLHADLQSDTALRDMVAFRAKSMESMYDAVDKVEEKQKQESINQNHKVEEERLSWYGRHRVSDGKVKSSGERKRERDGTVKSAEIDEEEAAVCFGHNMFGGGDAKACDGDY